MDSHRGQVEWLQPRRGQRGGLHLTINKGCLVLSRTAWRGLLETVGIQPPCEISLSIGYMRFERQVVIAVDEAGPFKVTIRQDHHTGWKCGGSETVAMLAEKGVPLGRYRVTVDHNHRRLLADVRQPIGAAEK